MWKISQVNNYVFERLEVDSAIRYNTLDQNYRRSVCEIPCVSVPQIGLCTQDNPVIIVQMVILYNYSLILQISYR